MEVRIAVLEDVNSICQLYNEFFEYNATLQPKYYRNGKENGSYPKSTIESKESDIFVVVDDNRICGFIHIQEAKTPPFDAFVPHKYAEIIDFIVTVQYRRRGAGAMLMDAAKKWSNSRGLEYMELLVLTDAKGEKLFYEQENFETVSSTMRCQL